MGCKYFLVLITISLCFHIKVIATEMNQNEESSSLAHVGVILDSNSSMSAIAEVCMDMALSDFYAAHPHYKTRVIVHKRDSDDIVGAASQAVDLLKNENVIAIVGLQRLTESTFAIELGRRTHVPIISLFSSASPPLPPTKKDFLVGTAPDDSSQLKALATIIQGFGWREVVVLFENTESDNQFVSYVTDAFTDAEIEVPRTISISASAENFQITKEFNKLMRMQTKVFLVHATPSLASRLFVLANKMGMMSKGFAWIVTDNLASMVKSMDMDVIESMEGVLGIRSRVPKSKNVDSFVKRWKRNWILTKPDENPAMELNIFGLMAYDLVQVLAEAVERIWPLNSTSLRAKNRGVWTDFADLGTSVDGRRLLHEILHTEFKGLSGEFFRGQLQPSSQFEIFNIIGNGERIVGYWTSEGRISRELLLVHQESSTYLNSTNELKTILWPGDALSGPVGFCAVRSLRVLVPKKEGFLEFLNVSRNCSNTNETRVTGYVKDVFVEALNLLPFKVEAEFFPFSGTYNDVVMAIRDKPYDAVMGDVTIVANRAKFVDFTLPYANSDIYMVVPIKQSHLKDMWIFVKPFSWDLWLTSLMACIFVGLVIRILERRAERPHTEFVGRLHQRPAMLVWLPFSVLFLPERQLVAKRSSRFVLVVWLCMSYILMQFYTANLSSMLTVDQLQPSMNKKGPYKVGYQKGSFVEQMLTTEKFGFTKERIKPYSTMEDYHRALSLGSHNGGVSAIYDDLPFIKLFVLTYGVDKYKMIGPVQRTDGLGFAFRIGSCLVSPLSRAILNITEDYKKMREIERRNFGHGYSIENEVVSHVNSETWRLNARCFAGPFIITGIAVAVALAYSEINSLWCRRLNEKLPSNGTDLGSRAHSTVVEMTITRGFPTADNAITREEHLPRQTSNYTDTNVSQDVAGAI